MNFYHGEGGQGKSLKIFSLPYVGIFLIICGNSPSNASFRRIVRDNFNFVKIGGHNMDWGMKNQLSQLIQKDGHCFFLPIDHGYFQGPTHCLEKQGKTIKPILDYCDALFVTRGVLRSCVDPANTKPIILRVSGGTSMVGADLANEIITTSIEEIVRLNASAVGVSIFVGTEYEKQTLQNLSELVNKCENY